MKRPVLYPFLFVLYVILAPLVHNLDQLDPSQALRPLILLWLAAAGGLLLFFLAFRDWQYAGYLVFLACLYFFASAYLNRFLRDLFSAFWVRLDERIFLAICTGALLFLALKGVWTRLGGHTWLPPYLNLAVSIGLLFPVIELIGWLVLDWFQDDPISRTAQARSGEIRLNCSHTPDIYYLILDGYGRADVLADLYEFDNRPFLEYLQRNGFYVATDSHTNYIQTIFSVPSSLNFRFIEPPDEGLSDQWYFSSLVKHNAIMAALKRCRYRTVAIESGFFFTDHPEVDVFYTQAIGSNEFENLLLADSPVDVLASDLGLEPSRYSYEAHRRRVLYSFAKLAALYKMPGPKFVFAHIISPHPPFVFDQGGNPLEPEAPYYIGDGDDYLGSLEEYQAGYPAQVQFVNQKLEQVIAALLARSSSPPIIILQGDHGPGSRLVWDSPEQTCLWERTPILNAYFLPGNKADWLYPSISPVNTFRVILNAYLGANLPILPDATYFTSHDLERQVIDITAQRTSYANCDQP